MYGSQLKVSREKYENRRDRLRKLIDLNAPDSIICAEARMVTECFQYGINERLNRWAMHRCPHWIWWICSSEYRQICKDQNRHDLDEFEEYMRKLLSLHAVDKERM